MPISRRAPASAPWPLDYYILISVIVSIVTNCQKVVSPRGSGRVATGAHVGAIIREGLKICQGIEGDGHRSLAEGNAESNSPACHHGMSRRLNGEFWVVIPARLTKFVQVTCVNGPSVGPLR